MKRRGFLQLVGGGVVLAAAGGGIYAATRVPTRALAPWAQAGAPRYGDPRMRALSYAILAPNPHNRQPWIVELEGEDAVLLRFDTTRQLPETDPFDRQLTIGLGCFLELMRMAAEAEGLAVDLALFPEGSDAGGLDERPVARAVFRKDAAAKPDPLWAHVMARRSNKEPYDTARAVAAETLAGVLGVARAGTALGGSVAEEDIAHWRALTEAALRIEIETPRTYRESVDLFRIGKREVTENPDGIDFTGPLFETLNRLGMFTRAMALDRSSSAYSQGIEAVLENCRTAMGHVWIVTGGNSRAEQIAAGGDWLRLNLAVARAGLGVQPLSQPLQEYPEMAGLYRETQAKLAPDGGTVQMLARIGYGPDVSVSPRWPIEAKLAG